MDMFIGIWKRADLRREMLIVILLVGVIGGLWVSGRSRLDRDSAAEKNSPSLAHVQAGPWSADLIRLEESSDRSTLQRTLAAALRVQGPSTAGQGDRQGDGKGPVEDASLADLPLEGGEWVEPVPRRTSASFIGPNGQSEALILPPGSGLAVLRFRGSAASSDTARPMILRIRIGGRTVSFAPRIPVRVPPGTGPLRLAGTLRGR